MGAGQTKINYEERDFTKEPLEEEEIDILLKALPEENVINSLDSEDREKIIRAMSDQKVFDIKGDNIFDYYFTNNRESIKGCMEDRIKQNNEPKFIATLEGSPTMELTIQDCREYANSIGAPFKPDYNNNTNPKGCFSQVNSAGINKVYYNNTSNEDTDCGAYGVSYCIKKNPTPTPCSDDNFNKMIDTIPGVINEPIQEILQNKNNEYNIEKSALQNQYDTLNTSKTELQSQYDTLNIQKDVLESEIQKNLLSNVIRVTDGDNTKTVSEQQCKEYAKSLGKTMEKGNDTSGCYLAPKSNDYGVYYNKKTGKGKCYYNNDSDYRKCIQNNLNRNNTYSKHSCKGNVGGDYDCRVDGTWDQITLKGWNRDKYGQTLDDAKHFCNTHKDCIAVASSNPNWNWPVHTTSKFKPCNKGDNCDPKMNYYTKQKCKKPIDGVWSKGVGKSCEWECPGRSGIEKYTVPKFHADKAYACSGREYIYDKEKKAHSGGNRKLTQGSAGYFSCRSQSGANFGWKSYKHQDGRMTYKSSCSDWDNPAMFYKEVSDDKEPSLTVSEEECKAYADTHGYNYSLDNIKNNNGSCQTWANGVECTSNPKYMWGNCKKACYEKFSPKGCVIRGNDVWFNKKESDRKCGEQSIKCIQLK